MVCTHKWLRNECFFSSPFHNPFPKRLRHATASPLGRKRFVGIATRKTSKSKQGDGTSDSGWMLELIHPECHALLIAHQFYSCLPSGAKAQAL
jgi:hypothetical protein